MGEEDTSAGFMLVLSSSPLVLASSDGNAERAFGGPCSWLLGLSCVLACLQLRRRERDGFVALREAVRVRELYPGDAQLPLSNACSFPFLLKSYSLLP